MNGLLLVVSMAYILSVLGVASVWVQKRDAELSRKFVHILLGNWIFIAGYHTRILAAIAIPLLFVVFNALSLKYRWISAMERNDDSLGTVYYALSLLVSLLIAHFTGWRMFPYIGILTMAYGDGLAALIGRRWGRVRPYSFAPDKTLLGSSVVAATSILVTTVVILLLGDPARIARVGVGSVVAIASATGILSAFIEAAGKRGCDNLTLPLGSGLFACFAFYYGTPMFWAYFFFSAALLAATFRMRAITADGAVAAILTAITLYALGGIWIGISLHLFYILGSAVSRIKNDRKRRSETRQEPSGARNWKQVVCNSLPACVLVWHRFFAPEFELSNLLAFGVFAAAAADTFSSEIGMLGEGRVFHILTGKTVPRGISGGVSWLGFAAGVAGGFLLALPAYPQFGWSGVARVTLMGLLGSLLDSVLGALFQRKYRRCDGTLSDIPCAAGDLPAAGLSWVSNNTVNLISLTLVPICGHLASALFGALL